MAHPYWQDYLSQNPESIHQIMILFSDRGTPDGYHQEHAYSGHAFKWLKDDGSFVYVQVHVRADKGFKVRQSGADDIRHLQSHRLWTMPPLVN